MEPTSAIYLLESEWGWEKKIPEVATITIPTEGPGRRSEFECLVDPYACRDYRAGVVSDLKRIAGAQAPNEMSSQARLIRLYRVTDVDGLFQIGLDSAGIANLDLTLLPICEFDDEGNPTLLEKSFREIRLDERPASRGKFRVVTFIDSILYQAGEETDTLQAAKELCKLVRGEQIRVYDDQGSLYVFNR